MREIFAKIAVPRQESKVIKGLRDERVCGRREGQEILIPRSHKVCGVCFSSFVASYSQLRMRLPLQPTKLEKLMVVPFTAAEVSRNTGECTARI